MKISEVAQRYGVSKRTLRYYEEIGLLCSEREGDKTERIYTANQIRKLEHILLLKKTGMMLKDIEILVLNQSIFDLSALLTQRFIAIEKQIDELFMQRALVEDLLIVSEKKCLEVVDFQELIKHHTYLKKYIQEIEGMKPYMEELVVLEFGAGLIQKIMEENLPEKVGSLKIEINQQTGRRLPLIRMRDNHELLPLGYRIFVKGIIVENNIVLDTALTISVLVEKLKLAILNNLQAL